MIRKDQDIVFFKIDNMEQKLGELKFKKEYRKIGGEENHRQYLNYNSLKQVDKIFSTIKDKIKEFSGTREEIQLIDC